MNFQFNLKFSVKFHQNESIFRHGLRLGVRELQRRGASATPPNYGIHSKKKTILYNFINKPNIVFYPSVNVTPFKYEYFTNYPWINNMLSVNVSLALLFKRLICKSFQLWK